MLHSHHHHKNSRLSEGRAGEALGNSKQNQAVSSVGQHWTQKYTHAVFPPFKLLMDKKFESLSREANENYFIGIGSRTNISEPLVLYILLTVHHVMILGK